MAFETDVGTETRTVPLLMHPLNNSSAQPHPLIVFEPGTDVTRTLEVTVTGPSGDGCAHVTGLAFDVVAMR